MTAKTPTASAISRLLAGAGFERSEVLSRAKLHHRYSAGFHVRAASGEVYVGWRGKTPLVSPSVHQAERDRLTALEMVRQYAEALSAKGWPTEVIHLNGPLARVTAKEA